MAVTTPAPAPADTPADTQPDTGTDAADQPRGGGLFASALTAVEPARPEEGKADAAGGDQILGGSSAGYHGDTNSAPGGASPNGRPQAKESVIRAWLLAGAARWAKGGGLAAKRLDVEKARAQAFKDHRQSKENINRTSNPLFSGAGGAGAGRNSAGDKGTGKAAQKDTGKTETKSPQKEVKSPQKPAGGAQNSPAGRGASGSGTGGKSGAAGGTDGRKGATGGGSGGAPGGGSRGATDKGRGAGPGGAGKGAPGKPDRGATKTPSSGKDGASGKQPKAPDRGATGGGPSGSGKGTPGATDGRKPKQPEPAPKDSRKSQDTRPWKQEKPQPAKPDRPASLDKTSAKDGPAPAPKDLRKGKDAPPEKPRPSDKRSGPDLKPAPRSKDAPPPKLEKPSPSLDKKNAPEPKPAPKPVSLDKKGKDSAPDTKGGTGRGPGSTPDSRSPKNGPAEKAPAPYSGLDKKDAPGRKNAPAPTPPGGKNTSTGDGSTPRRGLGERLKDAGGRIKDALGRDRKHPDPARGTGGTTTPRDTAPRQGPDGKVQLDKRSKPDLQKDAPPTKWDPHGDKQPRTGSDPKGGTDGTSRPEKTPRNDRVNHGGGKDPKLPSRWRRAYQRSRENGYRDGALLASVFARLLAYRDGARDGAADVAEAAERERTRLNKAHKERKQARDEQREKDQKEDKPVATATEQSSAAFHEDPKPIPAHVEGDRVVLGDGAARESMSRGEIRTLKGYERRLDGKAKKMQRVGEDTKGLKSHAEQQSQKVTRFQEAAKAVDGGEKLAATLARLQEDAKAQIGHAEELHKRAVRVADGAAALLHNVDVRYGAIYQAVVDSDTDIPAEISWYQDGGA